MTQRKKRPNLAEFAAEGTEEISPSPNHEPAPSSEEVKSVHKSVYVPPAVLGQLDLLAIQERPSPGRKKKFNTLILEGLDLLLKDRGLPSIADLTKEN